eukprot:10213450-Lingulodinium_polyedra.AAC.1
MLAVRHSRSDVRNQDKRSMSILPGTLWQKRRHRASAAVGRVADGCTVFLSRMWIFAGCNVA